MVTIVMPAHNELAVIEKTVAEWHSVAEKIPGASLLIVDDSSTDGTGEALERLAREKPLLHVLRNSKNLGHGGSTLVAFSRVETPFVMQTDSDGEFPAEEFWAFWERRETADFIFGYRAQRDDGPFRFLVTNALRLLILLLFGRSLRDVNCSFRLMRTDPMRLALRRVPEGAFIPLALLGIEAHRGPWRIENRPVRLVGRVGGESSLRGVRIWVLALGRSVCDLLCLRARTLSA